MVVDADLLVQYAFERRAQDPLLDERDAEGELAAGVAAINGALEAWVRTTAAELGGKLRINAVSPTVLTESLGKYGKAFPGFPSVSGAAVGQAYVRSIEGIDTGRVFVV